MLVQGMNGPRERAKKVPRHRGPLRPKNLLGEPDSEGPTVALALPRGLIDREASGFMGHPAQNKTPNVTRAITKKLAVRPKIRHPDINTASESALSRAVSHPAFTSRSLVVRAAERHKQVGEAEPPTGSASAFPIALEDYHKSGQSE